MLIEKIRPFLRNTVESLDLPIYIELRGDKCRPPGRLAMGDTLMVLGLLRNYGKPVTLYLDPPAIMRPLLEAHPLIRDIAAPQDNHNDNVQMVKVARSGRPATWYAKKTFNLKFGVVAVDKIRANPVLAHSLYYQLPRQDDWPSIMVDAKAGSLNGLLSRQKPNLVVFPFNPGRQDAFWQDEEWWWQLLRMLKDDFCLIAIGAKNYGRLSNILDAGLSMEDPASSLMNLAWLLHKAHGFIGRDGGPAHLATALNPNTVTIWDSMASYRFWAGSRGHHVLMSNPYLFRYPQAGRLSLEDLHREYLQINYVNAAGQPSTAHMPADSASEYNRQAVQIFGSLENLAAIVLNQREQTHDRFGAQGWLADAGLKQAFYAQSLDFTKAAIKGLLQPGHNWVAPWREQ